MLTETNPSTKRAEQSSLAVGWTAAASQWRAGSERGVLSNPLEKRPNTTEKGR